MSQLKKFFKVGLAVFGSLIFVTGVFKFLQLYHVIGFIPLPQYWINFIHDWSGIILVTLAVLNLVFSKIKPAEKNPAVFWERKFLTVRAKIWLLIFLLLLAGGVGFYYTQVIMVPGHALQQLASSQVKEYNGQKLSSITDIVDNAINGTQYIDIKAYLLEISGLVQSPKKYTYDQVLSFQKYQKVVELDCVTGWSAKILWEGVLVKDLLGSAGINSKANTVIFYAQDGYTTSLPLDYIENNNILLAYKMNNVVIPPEKGFPFQLVAEQKWGYKWIKWVTKIELSDDVNYQGTWEKAGYSNNGDVSGPKTRQ